MESLLSKAIEIALAAHSGQTDRAGMPYIGHVMRVMQAGKTDDEKIVGVLHDVVEDTNWTFEQLAIEGFPTHILDALHCITKLSDNEPYDQYIERVKPNSLARSVKINDLYRQYGRTSYERADRHGYNTIEEVFKSVSGVDRE